MLLIDFDLLCSINKAICNLEGLEFTFTDCLNEMPDVCKKEYDNPLDFAVDLLVIHPFNDGHHRTAIAYCNQKGIGITYQEIEDHWDQEIQNATATKDYR